MILKSPILAASLMPSNIIHTDDNIRVAMDKLRYPVLATTKYDGVRAIKWRGVLVSRTLKYIPNARIQNNARQIPDGIDVELTIDGKEFNEISGVVRNTNEKELAEYIQFNILDLLSPWEYNKRILDISANFINYRRLYPDHTHIPMVTPCLNASELFDFFILNEQNGHEGICFRTPDSPYKQGRSTLKEQYLVKLARFHTSEATIIGFEEQMENGNPDKRNACGLMKRSTNKEHMWGKDTLGALIVFDYTKNQEFSIGSGFTDKLRKEIWNNKERFRSQQITYKYKPCGMLDKPRHPTFVGFREKGF